MNEQNFLQFVVVSPQYSSARLGHDPIDTATTLLHSLLPRRLDFNVVAVPGAEWEIYIGNDDNGRSLEDDEITISVGLSSESAVMEFRKAVEDANASAGAAGKPLPFAEYGADVAGGETEYFCPASLDELLFGDRVAAKQLTGLCDLPRGLSGNGVNIVVLDHGFDRRRVRNFGGGWTRRGGPRPVRTDRGHGLMIVRNILETVPDATFWDIPLIPLAIDNVNSFLATARSAVRRMRQYVSSLGNGGRWIM